MVSLFYAQLFTLFFCRMLPLWDVWLKKLILLFQLQQVRIICFVYEVSCAGPNVGAAYLYKKFNIQRPNVEELLKPLCWI